ncbi:MAG: hypothetical protein ACYC1M_18295 [Armatimonadota bacterium]
MKKPIVGCLGRLCITITILVWAVTSMFPDYSATLTCGDGFQYSYCLPYSNGDAIWPKDQNLLDWKVVSDVKDQNEANMYVSQYRCLKNALIGVGFLGYFVYDNKTNTCYLTSHYDKWCKILHNLHISPTTTMYPTPIRGYYKVLGWLGYQKGAE